MANQISFLFSITITIFFLSLSSHPQNNASACDENDQKALLKIKKSLNNTPFLSSWTPSTNCCTWSNIECNNSSRVTLLHIMEAPFSSKIPSAIGDLSALEILTLSHTPFHGPIPQSLAKLSNLQSLTILQTSVSGPIPDFRVNTKLTNLKLAFNRLSGPIPTSLERLSSLESLNLRHNRLTGSIPPGLFRRSKKGTDLYLQLSENRLSGSVPEFLGDGEFKVFDLSRNRLSGGADFMSAPTKAPESVDMSWNMLDFDFTNVSLSKNIVNLDLSHNRIQGAIPESLNELKLLGLDLSYNKLCGEIPAGEVASEFGADSYQHNECSCGDPMRLCAL